MHILLVIFYSQFDNTFDLVNKVQYDRVVLIRRRFIIRTEPHLAGLDQQPDLFVHTHQLIMRIVLLLITDEHDFRKRL